MGEVVYLDRWAGPLANTGRDAVASLRALLSVVSPDTEIRLEPGVYTFLTNESQNVIEWPQTHGVTLSGAGLGVTTIRCHFGLPGAANHRRIFSLHGLAPAGIRHARLRDFTICGAADGPNVPNTAIGVRDYIDAAQIERVEVYWFRGAAVRETASHHGRGVVVRDCYFHDLNTVAMNADPNVEGDAGAIVGQFARGLIERNRLVNVGDAPAAGNRYHALYVTGDDIDVRHNACEGAHADIIVGDGATRYVRASVVGNSTKGDRLLVLGYDGAVVAQNIVVDAPLRLSCTGFACAGNVVSADTAIVSGLLTIQGASDGIAQGNVLRGNTATGTIGVFLTGAVRDVVIMGNRISGVTEGVVVDTDATVAGICCDGNQMVGLSNTGGTCAVSVSGCGAITDSQFRGNTLRSFNYVLRLSGDATRIVVERTTLSDVRQVVVVGAGDHGQLVMDEMRSCDAMPYTLIGGNQLPPDALLTNIWRYVAGAWQMV